MRKVRPEDACVTSSGHDPEMGSHAGPEPASRETWSPSRGANAEYTAFLTLSRQRRSAHPGPNPSTRAWIHYSKRNGPPQGSREIQNS